MKRINEGDLYNKEQVNVGKGAGSKKGLDAWKKAAREQLLRHLKNKSPKETADIIRTTFGDILS